MKILRIIIFILPCCLFSQDIYHGDFNNKFLAFNNTNELKNDRTFVQLILNDDMTYVLEGYVYGKKRCQKIIVNCSNQKGIWRKEGQILILESNKNMDYNKLLKYTMSVDEKKLHIFGLSKKRAKKMQLKKTSEYVKVSCPEIKSRPKNDLN